MNHTANYLHVSSHLIKVVVYPTDTNDKTGYGALVPSIPGIVSYGHTKEEAFTNIEDALRLTIRTYKDTNIPIPWHPEGEESMIRTVSIPAEDMPVPEFKFTVRQSDLNTYDPQPPSNETFKPMVNSWTVTAVVTLCILWSAALVYYLTP